MNFVIPMGGRGERFGRAGFTTPKLLLQAHGKTLLEWSVDSLPLSLCDRLVFVGLREHQQQHDLESWLRERYAAHNPQFQWLAEPTRGQAETVYVARELFDESKPLLIFNIDTAFRSATLAEALKDSTHDGVLGSFPSREPRFSFAREEGGIVREVREKDVISEHALTGLYHFQRTTDFLEIAREAISRNETEKGEFFVAPLYNKLIARRRRFVLAPAEQHWILGTPEEFDQFLRVPKNEL